MLPLACLLSIFGILQDQEPIPIDPPAPPPPKVESKVQLTGTGKVEEIVGASNRSSLPPGRHFQLDERSTTLWRLEGNRSLEMITAARATDDIRSDPDKYNVTQFTIHYKTPDFTASAGDVGASFSSYTLSGAFRGLHFDGLTNKLKIKALVGTSKPQWRMHFQDEPGEPPDRFFQGVRGEVNNEGQTVVAGLNIVHARDDLGSIKDKTGFVGIDSWVTGADVRWMVNEVWLIKAETAVTLFDPNIDLEEDEEASHDPPRRATRPQGRRESA